MKCHIEIYSKSPHLNQIYTGFKLLKKNGLIDLTWGYKMQSNEPWCKVVLNNKINIIYDVYDSGNRFVDQSYIDKADFYFKRSSSKNNKHTIPLGLNYNLTDKFSDIESQINIFKNIIKGFIKGKKYNFYTKDFEWYPLAKENSKICFLTRLWDPYSNEVENEDIKNERIKINNFRIECIKRCQKEFRESFIGGIQKDKYSLQNYPEYVVDDKYTKKEEFLKIIKESDICVATTGLHGSIGWKFAEYVAASRAIVSEKLNYDLPGNFSKNNNYLEFNNVDSLINKIYLLKNDKLIRSKIMKNNYIYYNSYLKPEKLILNTLIYCLENNS
ncbi:hypothetical protein [Clostridium perfringens]|uniref:hypothetical protein n=1 Tax=Clostridium perfringens TaxID=1502 RepID=UPI001A2C5544|nr:hypothetical protein [Clostridium perfringens]MDH5068016.1 hypothetical protein [Clostridium perfringens]HAT4119823.1 hypothetical protein [Clostridium perfringens]HAT4120717.1 hypothetical protein [Clostridium perfringens]